MCGDWGCAPTRKFAEVDTVALLAKSTCGYSCPACEFAFVIQMHCLHSNFSFYEIVRGCEPEFEEVEVVAASFSEFIEKVINGEIKL